MKKILTLLLGLMMTMSASAELFLYKYEGTRLTYKIINEKEHTCAVSLCKYVSGDVVIPEFAKDEDVAYRVTAIDDYAFSESGLKSIVIPESVAEIGNSAFEMSGSLESVTLPPTITTIKFDTFNSCSSLTSICIPSSVTSIDNRAFYCCDNLSTVSLSESLKSIGEEAFSGCRSITSIQIPSTVTQIGKKAFIGCKSLSSVTLPESLKEIKEGVFCETGLPTISLPRSLSTIGPYAFAASKLTTVAIPTSVTLMYGSSFASCSTLKEINVDSGNPYYESKEGILYDKGMKALITYPGAIQECNIPSTVEYIGYAAFQNCKNLETVVIPENVVCIGYMAFDGCTNLQRLTIPGKVKEIESYAFSDLRNLKEVYYNTTEVLDLGDQDIFSFYFHPEATLYVAPGGLESAKSTSPWRDFGKIEEFDFSKADEIPADPYSMSSTEIFTLDGKRIAGEAGLLAPGIYIIRQEGQTRKIAVK